jgi:hypothetical protein
MPGETGFYKVKGKLLIIEIVACIAGSVIYKFPLRPKAGELTCNQSDIYLPLGDLKNHSELSLI